MPCTHNNDPNSCIECEIDTILSMSDEEVMAQALREELDPEAIARDMRKNFELIVGSLKGTSL